MKNLFSILTFALFFTSSAYAQYNPSVGAIGTFAPGDLVIGYDSTNRIQDAASASPVFWNSNQNLQIAGFLYNDNVAAATLAPTQQFGAFVVQDDVFSGATGNHSAIVGFVDVQQSPTTSGPYNFVGVWGFSFCNANLGGTSGSTKGECFGVNPQAQITSSATYWTELNGDETDVEADAAVAYKWGINVTTIGSDAYQGTSGDAAILIGSVTGSPKWQNGFALSNFNGAFPIASSGSVINVLTAGTVAYGINFTNLTCSTDCIATTGFTIDGTGRENITIPNSNALISGMIEQYNVVYGTVPSGQCLDGDVCYAQHQIQMFDSVDPVSAAGGTSTAALYIHMKGPNTNGTGQTIPLVIHGEVSNAPSVGNASSYVGETIFEDSAINVGGTAGTPAGGIFGTNILARLVSSSATYWSVLQGGEVDVSAVSGSSVNYRMGWSIVDYNSGGVQGTADDVALNIGSVTGGPGWKKGISFGNFNGQFPIASSGSLITTSTGTAAYGINFSNLTCSTDCWKSNGATIDGSGNISAASVNLAGTTAPSGAAGVYLVGSSAVGFGGGGNGYGYISAQAFFLNQSQNQQQFFEVYNVNTGTSAQGAFALQNASVTAAVALNGSGYSTNPNYLLIANNNNIGIELDTSGNVYLPSTVKVSNLLMSATAPTFTSGACTGSIGTTNGTSVFTFSTGTGTCGNTATIGLPTAANGWSCQATDIAQAGTARIQQTAGTTSSVVFTNYSIGSSPAATAFTASHTVRVMCSAY